MSLTNITNISEGLLSSIHHLWTQWQILVFDMKGFWSLGKACSLLWLSVSPVFHVLIASMAKIWDGLIVCIISTETCKSFSLWCDPVDVKQHHYEQVISTELLVNLWNVLNVLCCTITNHSISVILDRSGGVSSSVVVNGGYPIQIQMRMPKPGLSHIPQYILLQQHWWPPRSFLKGTHRQKFKATNETH